MIWNSTGNLVLVDRLLNRRVHAAGKGLEDDAPFGVIFLELLVPVAAERQQPREAVARRRSRARGLRPACPRRSAATSRAATCGPVRRRSLARRTDPRCSWQRCAARPTDRAALRPARAGRRRGSSRRAVPATSSLPPSGLAAWVPAPGRAGLRSRVCTTSGSSASISSRLSPSFAAFAGFGSFVTFVSFVPASPSIPRVQNWKRAPHWICRGVTRRCVGREAPRRDHAARVLEVHRVEQIVGFQEHIDARGRAAIANCLVARRSTTRSREVRVSCSIVMGARFRDWRNALMIARLPSLSAPPAFLTRPAGRS